MRYIPFSSRVGFTTRCCPASTFSILGSKGHQAHVRADIEDQDGSLDEFQLLGIDSMGAVNLFLRIGDQCHKRTAGVRRTGELADGFQGAFVPHGEVKLPGCGRQPVCDERGPEGSSCRVPAISPCHHGRREGLPDSPPDLKRRSISAGVYLSALWTAHEPVAKQRRPTRRQ